MSIFCWCLKKLGLGIILFYGYAFYMSLPRWVCTLITSDQAGTGKTSGMPTFPFAVRTGRWAINKLICGPPPCLRVRCGRALKLNCHSMPIIYYCTFSTRFPVSQLFYSYWKNLVCSLVIKYSCIKVNASRLMPWVWVFHSRMFQLRKTGFRYLGPNITRSLPSVLSANFLPLLEQTKSDFQRWSSLPLSLIGQINLVKMNVSPKFLFAF